jgi:hypothetical protein
MLILNILGSIKPKLQAVNKRKYENLLEQMAGKNNHWS